ncbi:class I SAM-dependent rRNA methyltransferase [uncultured Turicimonas sp.]|uniref:class I SAM-dependent rRNA methyltransferase n=1 Tax=uncultured Turicimonas sp. TaxID=1918607 RepID=UPI0035A59F24
MKTNIPTLILKPGKERALLRRHPWVYSTGVANVKGKPQSGDTIKIVDNKGNFLAWGAYSPESALRARCWSFNEQDVINEEWIRARVFEAIRARDNLKSRTNAIRLIFGEADFLPGLIVDQYDTQLVTQFQAAGVEKWRPEIGKALTDATGFTQVFDRSDAATRAREGLPERKEVLEGEEPPEKIQINEDGILYGVDVRMGHKTGFYVDQRDNRRLARQLAETFRKVHGRGMRALNCFCYTGGFSLALAKGGAEEVISIDSSADALEMAKSNAKLNGFNESQMKWVEANVFEQLRKYRDAGEKFDLVILDPPKFASSHHHVEKAARAYKDINLNGLRLLNEGAQLLTFSCSGAIDVDLFQKIVAGAVIDAKTDAWMISRLGAGSDHPLLMTHPEGEYLKGLHLVSRGANTAG